MKYSIVKIGYNEGFEPIPEINVEGGRSRIGTAFLRNRKPNFLVNGQNPLKIEVTAPELNILAGIFFRAYERIPQMLKQFQLIWPF